jgi:hypothetical protein
MLAQLLKGFGDREGFLADPRFRFSSVSVPLNLRSVVTPPNPCMRFTFRILYVKYSVVMRDQRGYGGSEDPESQRSVRK